jgi:hypothetical protein
MMPYLLNFFENNGTFLSNSHTPLIARTADDILTTNTGGVWRPAGHAGPSPEPSCWRITRNDRLRAVTPARAG